MDAGSGRLMGASLGSAHRGWPGWFGFTGSKSHHPFVVVEGPSEGFRVLPWPPGGPDGSKTLGYRASESTAISNTS
jgi:hypothetical protein